MGKFPRGMIPLARRCHAPPPPILRVGFILPRHRRITAAAIWSFSAPWAVDSGARGWRRASFSADARQARRTPVGLRMALLLVSPGSAAAGLTGGGRSSGCQRRRSATATGSRARWIRATAVCGQRSGDSGDGARRGVAPGDRWAADRYGGVVGRSTGGDAGRARRTGEGRDRRQRGVSGEWGRGARHGVSGLGGGGPGGGGAVVRATAQRAPGWDAVAQLRTNPPEPAGRGRRGRSGRVGDHARTQASLTRSAVAGTSLIICDGSGPTPR